MARRGRPGVRRLLTAAGGLMLVAAVVVLVAGGGDGGEPDAPERAGSRFAHDEGHAARRQIREAEETTVLGREIAGVFAAGVEGARAPRRVYGGVYVTAENAPTSAGVRAILQRVDRAARREKRPEPLAVADPEQIPAIDPAGQPGLGATRSQRRVREAALAAGRRARRAGVDVVLAPSADLAVAGTPAETRAFGDDPRTVAALVFQAVDGWRAAGVAPVPGRFPGEGGASQDPLEGPATVGLALPELLERDTRPFAGVIATAPGIQMSAALYAAWDGVTPATVLPEAVRLLRGKLRYNGTIVSADLLGVAAASGQSIGAAAVDALRAGCDLLLVPGSQQEQEQAFQAVLEAVRRGRLARSRVQEALGRVAALRRAVRSR